MGDLIQVKPAQPLADFGQSGIVPGRPDGPGQILGVRRHGAELDELEMFSPPADPLLNVEYRPAIFQSDDYGDRDPEQQPQGSEQQIDKEDEDKIEGAFVAVGRRRV